MTRIVLMVGLAFGAVACWSQMLDCLSDRFDHRRDPLWFSVSRLVFLAVFAAVAATNVMLACAVAAGRIP